MANVLLDALQGVGHVLDTPGSVVRGLLSGNTDAALGGIVDPSKRVSGRDLLNKWGITDNNSGVAGDIGGFAAGLATDPLMWLGGGALGKLLSRGGKAEEAASVVAKAAPTSGASTLLEAAPGLSGYERGADGLIRRTAALPETTTQRIGALGEKLGGGPGQLSEAEQWTGNRLSSGMTAMNNDLIPGVSAGPVSPLLNLRRDFSVLKDVGTDMAGRPQFNAIGGLEGGTDRIRQILDGGRKAVQAASEDANSGLAPLSGIYRPGSRTAAILDGTIGTTRHESMHGLIDAARRSGDASGLSTLPRASLNMQGSSNSFLRGLGQIGEEASAYGAEGRGLTNQLGNIWKFLDNPTAGYASEFAGTSPLAAKLYSMSAIPNSARLAGAGAAGLGAYLGGNALLGGN